MNINKITAIISAAAVFAAPAAYADISTVSYNRDTNIAAVTGKAERGGKAVSLRVERDGSIVYEDQINAGSDGTYTHMFKVSGTECDYNITVGEEGVKTPFTATLHYYGSAQAVLAEINEISKSGSDTAMKDKITANLDLLFETDDVIKSALSGTQDYTVIYKKLADGTQYATADELGGRIKLFLTLYNLYAAQNTADFMSALETGKDSLLIADSTVYETLKDSGIFGTSAIDEVCALMYGKDYADAASFKSYFEDTVLTYAVSKANGWGDAKAVIEKNSAVIGVDTSKAKDERSVYSYILTCSITNKGDIKTAFDKGVNRSDDSGSGSGSGSGKGSGGKTTGGSSTGGITLPAGTGEAPKDVYAVKQFSDLDGYDWAKEHIEKLSQYGVVEGMGGSEFAPSASVTREAFVKMIVTAFKMHNENDTVTFADVPEGEWYYSYVASAVRHGIINGIDSANFGTGREITRQDMAVIAYRAAKAAGKTFGAEASELEFADAQSISDYARESIAVLTANKILNGTDGNKFLPQGVATRAEAAVVISSLFDLQ